ncbi:MAG: GH25 family lysozyme [Ahrensia sp.]|nr:GH25 family lysozyme [Ahrensia sp.]
MRLTLFVSLAVASTMLSGCTSSTDALTLRPSTEIVASINPPIQEAPKITTAQPRAALSEPIPQEVQNPFPATPQFVAQEYVEPPKPNVISEQPLPKPAPVEIAMVKPQEPSPIGNRAARQKIYAQNFRDAKPIKFSQASHPKNFDVHGVDVSRWQNDIDWKKLRTQGANFAFIKSTDGGDHLDPMFKTNWEGAKAAGIPRGAYHFMYWCRSGEAQAKWFIRHVPKEKGALPPVIDAEWNHQSRTCKGKPSPQVIRARMQTFMDIVEAHYGQRPIIYTAPDFYEDNLRGHFKDYPFWLRSVAQHPNGRYPERKFLFWQYSGTGLSKGVSTQIDLNVFNGSEAGWQKWVADAVLK